MNRAGIVPKGSTREQHNMKPAVICYIMPRSKSSASGVSMATKNAFYAQSGGVTAVINASACGVIETARKHPDKIGKVYAGNNGILGALTEDLIDTSAESDTAIAALKHTPGGAFGSCRYKLRSFEENRREYERLVEGIEHDATAALAKERDEDVKALYTKCQQEADTSEQCKNINERKDVPLFCSP